MAKITEYLSDKENEDLDTQCANKKRKITHKTKPASPKNDEIDSLESAFNALNIRDSSAEMDDENAEIDEETKSIKMPKTKKKNSKKRDKKKVMKKRPAIGEFKQPNNQPVNDNKSKKSRKHQKLPKEKLSGNVTQQAVQQPSSDNENYFQLRNLFSRRRLRRASFIFERVDVVFNEFGEPIGTFITFGCF